ncbi:M16 family metallopeptidase [Acidobacteriota bacterium]
MQKESMINRANLSNGITVVTERIPNIRSVTIGVWLRSGARFEIDEKGGIFHVLEHLLFKRTKKRSTRDIARIIDVVGGQCNAFTDKEYICFYSKAIDEHIDIVLDLLSDILINPDFKEEDLEGEKRVILEEIKMMEDAPELVLITRLMRSVWKKHPLSRLTIGSHETVMALTRDEVEDFFRREFTAGRMLITAAGNLEHEAILAKLENYFEGALTGGEVPGGTPPLYTRSITSEQKNELKQVHLCLMLPTFKRNHPDRFSLAVLITLLGNGMSSRLFQKVREERGLVYDIDAEGISYQDCGYLMVYAGTGQEALNEVISITIDEFRDLQRLPPHQDEVYRAKEHLKGSLMLGLENTFQRMAHLASQEMYFGGHVSLDEILNAIDRVSVDDVHRVSERVFSSHEVSAGILGKVDDLHLMEDALRC